MKTKKTSQLSGFYRKTIKERTSILRNWSKLSNKDINTLIGENGLALDDANHMIENVIGLFNMPFGIATNFKINDRDYLIPMVIEEPSVVAAVSNAAKMFRLGGGFITKSDAPIMIGQIQLLDIDDITTAQEIILANKTKLLNMVNAIGGSIVKSGGGALDIECRPFINTSVGNMLVIHLLYDTRDAMGANAINTAVEYIAPEIEQLAGGRVNLRILSNLTDRRKAYAEGMVPASALERGEITGEQAVKAIVEAGVFAEVDPYRATTHNKGIMNGIDAVLLATGNDWRAVEGGAHAYASRNGQYTSMTKWWQDEDGNLRGSIEIPLAVGIVGGATRVHPTAGTAMKILDVSSAQELSEVIVAVGLAQNFAAIRALATEGIQHGHMRMHARQLAVAAGAENNEVMQVVTQMTQEKNIRLQRAEEILAQLRGDKK